MFVLHFISIKQGDRMMAYCTRNIADSEFFERARRSNRGKSSCGKTGNSGCRQWRRDTERHAETYRGVRFSSRERSATGIRTTICIELSGGYPSSVRSSYDCFETSMFQGDVYEGITRLLVNLLSH